MAAHAKRIPKDGPGPWGVYDTVDDCWLGPADGPSFVFEFREAVTLCCQRISARHRFPDGRVVPRTYDPDALRFKDMIHAPDPIKPPALRLVE